MSDSRSILCVPFAPVLGNVTRNQKLLTDLAGAVAAGGNSPDIVVLPELALTGYVLESLVVDSALTVAQVEELAGELTTTGVSAKTEWVLGLALREGNDIFNVAVVLAEGKIRHMQRKLFLPTYGMFDEARYFMRGADFSLYQGALGKTAILICEDAWHLELAYAASVARADAVVVISSSPARGYSVNPGFNSTRFWRNRLQTCVLSYGQNYIYSNRGGVEDGIIYDGSNFVIDSGANFLPHLESTAHAGACLYELPAAGTRRPGLSGNSSQQNDIALVKSILDKLSLPPGTNRATGC